MVNNKLLMVNSLPEMPKYEAYKDSGIEWLGEIPETWETKRLSVIGNFSKGGGFSKSDLTSQGVSAILYGDIYTKYDQLIDDVIRKIPLNISKNSIRIKKGDVLFTGSGETKEDIGKCVVYSNNEPAYAGGDIIVFKQKTCNSSFLTFCLNTHGVKEEKAKTSKGEIIVHTYASKLREIRIPIPTNEEQTAIANFLDQKTSQIDQAIAIKEKQISLLKERKQILIQQAVTRGLNPNAPMRDSGVEWIGEIPEHWEVKANFFLFTERAEPGIEGLPLLSVSIHSGVSSGEMTEGENIRGRIKIEDKTKYNLVKPYDIVFNMMRAWQGGIGAVTNKGMVSPAYIIAKPTKDIETSYFEYQYRTPIFIQQMDRFSKGITDFRKRLYWNEFKRLKTVVPPFKEQELITVFIKKQSSKINQAITLQNQQIEKLKEYKTTLINSAVTGKIKILSDELV